MLIIPEILACARVVNPADSRAILHHVQVDRGQATATNGRVLVVAQYEPELDAPDDPVLVNAESLLLLEKTKDPLQLENTGNGMRLVSGVYRGEIEEPEGVYPNIRKGVESVTGKHQDYTVSFSVAVLSDLIKAVKASTSTCSDRITFQFFKGTEMVAWEVDAKTEGARLFGVVMPLKVPEDRNPMNDYIAPAEKPDPAQPEPDPDQLTIEDALDEEENASCNAKVPDYRLNASGVYENLEQIIIADLGKAGHVRVGIVNNGAGRWVYELNVQAGTSGAGDGGVACPAKGYTDGYDSSRDALTAALRYAIRWLQGSQSKHAGKLLKAVNDYVIREGLDGSDSEEAALEAPAPMAEAQDEEQPEHSETEVLTVADLGKKGFVRVKIVHYPDYDDWKYGLDIKCGGVSIGNGGHCDPIAWYQTREICLATALENVLRCLDGHGSSNKTALTLEAEVRDWAKENCNLVLNA